jgi:PXA domain
MSSSNDETTLTKASTSMSKMTASQPSSETTTQQLTTTTTTTTTAMEWAGGGDTLFGWVPPSYLQPYVFYIKAAGGCLVAFFLISPDKFLIFIWHLVWMVVGLTLGIGLGAGLALHVFHQLQAWQKAHDDNKRKRLDENGDRRSMSVVSTPKRKSLVRDSSNTPTSVMSSSAYHHHMNSSTSFLEDGNSYWSLMAQAGYPIVDRVLRGQVLRKDHSFFNKVYQFTDATVRNQQAVQLMAEEFPALPEPVTREMGRFIEHVMRDYIAGWYSRLDNGVLYQPEEEKRKQGIPRDGADVVSNGTTTGASNGVDESESSTTLTTPSKKDSRRQRSGSTGSNTPATPSRLADASSSNNSDEMHSDLSHAARQMVFTTLTHRRAPMIDCTYRVLASAFGNLATRAEHVNVFELVLLKWTQVLGHTFKTYRNLRKVAQDKNASHGIVDRPPTETEVTREYLLAGKLHRAIIFGLDVPSLLFADASGEECGCGTEEAPRDPTHVLEQRLYHTDLIRECELDYNRVVSSRLIRALLPKSESNSNCVRALVVEIFAACVFQPLMNLWEPSFLNDIIVKAVAGNGDSSNTSGSSDNGAMAETEPKTESSDYVTDDETTAVVDDDEAHERDIPNVVDDSIDSDSPSYLEEKDDIAIKAHTNTSQALISVSSESDQDNTFPFEEGEASVGDKVLTLSGVALAELAKFMDFDECRDARTNHQETGINWDDPDCQTAVLKLVLVIEAALLDGRCAYRKVSKASQLSEAIGDEVSEDEVLSEKVAPSETITHLLMEMTSDMAAFEKRIVDDERPPLLLEDASLGGFQPDPDEISTLRTLISTWLHTGQLHKALSLVSRAADSVFAPFYADGAFLTNATDREKLVKEMKNLNGVDILVETMVVLSSPKLDIAEEYALMTASVGSFPRRLYNGQSPSIQVQVGNDAGQSSEALARDLAEFGHATPRFLDFKRNAALTGGLRAERERRHRAWEARPADNSITTIIRKTATKKIDFELHSELHNLVRLFSNGTNVLSIRDAARKSDDGEDDGKVGNEKVSLLTVETASGRRRLEVPDDDSSFLLRAQARKLNPISVLRDDRNHENSYQRFLATYEEPAIAPGSNRYNGGRFVRRCFLDFYPSNRTASISPITNDAKKLDKRKGRSIGTEQATDQNATPYFNAIFLRERHLCQKWSQKSTQSFLSSTIMESTDFNSAPRNGKALDFVYRMSLFEHPVVDLAGKRFTIQDPTNKGVHRADASSLEISDASLSHLLLYIGKDWGQSSTLQHDVRHGIEMGPDGYPMIFFRINTKVGEKINTEIKPYRIIH